MRAMRCACMCQEQVIRSTLHPRYSSRRAFHQDSHYNIPTSHRELNPHALAPTPFAESPQRHLSVTGSPRLSTIPSVSSSEAGSRLSGPALGSRRSSRTMRSVHSQRTSRGLAATVKEVGGTGFMKPWLWKRCGVTEYKCVACPMCTLASLYLIPHTSLASLTSSASSYMPPTGCRTAAAEPGAA